MRNAKWYTRFAKVTARFSGRPIVFAAAVAVIAAWVVSGPLFGFSDTWQLVINTGTTIITFPMVFLIQNTQNDVFKARYQKLARAARAEFGHGTTDTGTPEA